MKSQTFRTSQLKLPNLWRPLLVIALSIDSADRDDLRTEVRVYCASAAVEPFYTTVEQFNSSDLARSEGIIVEITREGGSGALAGQLNAEALTGIQNMADIFICADSNRMSNLINQKDVNNLPALLNLELKLGIGSDSSAIGFETRRIAESSQCRELLQARKTADFENVMSLAQALSIGSIDVAIIWDSTVHQFNQTDNPAIKILAYLNSDTEKLNSITINPKENPTSSRQKFSPTKRFSKVFSDNSNRPGCFIEAGRSISDSHQADLFFSYLKTNRDEVLSNFVDAGFSNLPLESSLNNGRESNQQ